MIEIVRQKNPEPPITGILLKDSQELINLLQEMLDQ